MEHLHTVYYENFNTSSVLYYVVLVSVSTVLAE